MLLFLVLLAFPLAQLFGALIMGDISDRYGRKKTLTLTIAGSMLGYILTGMAITTQIYSLILFSRIFAGFFASSLTLCFAIFADIYTNKKERSKAFGLLTTCIGVSWSSAIIASTKVLNIHDVRHLYPSIPFWGMALIMFSCLIILQLLFTETATIRQKVKRSLLKTFEQILYILNLKKMKVLYLTLFFWLFGFIMQLQWSAPFSIDRLHSNHINIIWMFTLQGISWALGGIFLNYWITEHFHLWKAAVWSLFCVSLFYFFMANAEFFFYFLLSSILATIFASFLCSSMMSLISISTEEGTQGKSLGIGQATFSLAQLITLLIGGIIAGFSVDLVFYTSSILVFAGFLILLVFSTQLHQNSSCH